MSSLFLQGLTFTALVIGLLAVLAWWLYLSPLKRNGSPIPAAGAAGLASSARLSLTLALLIGIGSLLNSFGGYWDLSEHLVTGVVPGGEDFLWPPHLMVYAGFLLAFVVAVSGLAAVALPNLRRGIKDPRRWVRSNPYVGAVVLIAGYGLLSIPGDAIWHELYGIDLTAWSPPHLFLTASAASLPVFAAALFQKKRIRKCDRPQQQARRRSNAAQDPNGPRLGAGTKLVGFAAALDSLSIVRIFYLANALLLLVFVGVVEWEVDSIDRFVAQRPIWLYPTIIGVSAFFLSVVARRLAPGPWTATVLALFYFGLRTAVSAFADALSGAPPRMTLVFILGAVLLDLTCQRMERSGFKPADWRLRLASAGAFTVGYSLVAQPTIQLYLMQFLPAFTFQDHLLAALFTFLVSAAIYPAPLAVGGWLSRSEMMEEPAAAELPHPVTAAV